MIGGNRREKKRTNMEMRGEGRIYMRRGDK